MEDHHQNAPSQQVEAGSAVALPLQQFESGDLAFCLTIAPRQGQGSAHRIAVLLQPGGERLDGADAARAGFGQPGIQISQGRGGTCRLPNATCPDKGGEAPCKGCDQGGFLVLLDPVTAAAPIGGSAAGGCTSNQASCFGDGSTAARFGVAPDGVVARACRTHLWAVLVAGFDLCSATHRCTI